MRFGPIPTTLAERFALAAGLVPVPLLDMFHGMIKARVVMAGVRLGIFEALAEEPQDAATLAARLRLDEGSLELLLRTLVLAEYLALSGGRYRPSALTRRTLVPGATMPMAGFAEWNYTHWEWMGRLEDLVRTGRGVDFHETLRDPEAWRYYQEAMLDLARTFAPEIARLVPVRRGAARLLDVAGSHGLVGAALCRRHPPMRSTVLDLPQAVPHARALAVREAIADLVEHREGNLVTDDFGAGWDVVVLSNILHHFEPPQIAEILRRVHAATGPEGTVAIWEVERPERGAPPAVGDGAALFFRLTSTAGAYHGREYERWLLDAGFTGARIRRSRVAPGDVLVYARR